MLILILSASLIAFSESATNSFTTISRDTPPQVSLPRRVAVEVVKDIYRLDSLQVELDISKANFKIQESTITLKDSILNIKESQIGLLKDKNTNYEGIITIMTEQKGNLEVAGRRLTKELKREKRKHLATKVGGGAIILLLTYLVISK